MSDPTNPTPAGGADAGQPGVCVGAYEGIRAGEAAAAIRRLGLRPALERVEGYEQVAPGLVISQTPAAGSEVRLGSAVSLGIAAPARGSVESEPRPAVEPDTSGRHVAHAGEPPLERREEEPTEEPGEGVDVEEWWVGDGAYADETVEIHELAPPQGDGESWEPDTDEPDDGYDEDWAADAKDSEEVWRGSPSARRAQRWTVTDEWRAGAFMVWLRSLPRGLRWTGAALALVTGVIAVGTLSGGSNRPPAQAGGARVIASNAPAQGTRPTPSSSPRRTPARPYRTAPAEGHPRLARARSSRGGCVVVVRRPAPVIVVARAQAPVPVPARQAPAPVTQPQERGAEAEFAP